MNLLERHALYNLIRMNWLNDPQLSVEPWQVEDYRALPLPALFERLKTHSIDLDKAKFTIYADECDSPEELSEHLIGDHPLEAKIEDQIYLIIFELWRRLMTEKPSLSIFCSELDYQIYLHDREELSQPSHLQNALANFALLLNENVDQGFSTQEAFKLITPYFANDIESFLYDYIYELIEEDNESYAQDLLDNFAPYLKGNKWFELLYIRLIERSNNRLADKLLIHLIEDYFDEKDVDFNLELLGYMIDIGKSQEFKKFALQTIEIINNEEEFQDLLMLTSDYFHRLDNEIQEKQIQSILKNREQKEPETALDTQDTDRKSYLKLMQT
jgi:hypothetical protein